MDRRPEDVFAPFFGAQPVEDSDFEYDGIGRQLREAREAAGYSAAQVAAALKIREDQLDSIEGGRFDELPGAVYAQGFLRGYAEILGFDRHQVIAAFKEEAGALSQQDQFDFLVPTDETSLPRTALLVFLVLLAAVSFGLWHYVNGKERVEMAAVEEVPDRLAHLAKSEVPSTGGAREAPARAEVPPPTAMMLEARSSPDAPVLSSEGEDTASAATERSIAPSFADGAAPAVGDGDLAAIVPQAGRDLVDDAALPRNETAGGIGAGAAETATSVASQAGSGLAAHPADAVGADRGSRAAMNGPPEIPEAPAGGESSGARTFGQANTESRVVLRAQADSWVQIHGVGNELILTRVLRQGDVYRVPNRDDLVMMTGNAGGLEVVVDGKTLPPFGPDGAVRRNISLSVDSLLAKIAASQ